MSSVSCLSNARPLESVQSRAAKGGFVGGLNFAIGLGLNLLQVPLLVRLWSQETYGLWLSVGALASLLTTLDIGHQTYVGNLLSRYFVEDRAAFQKIFASAVRITVITSTLQIILTLILCTTGIAAHWLGIEANHSAEFSIAVVVYTIGWISTGSVGAILVKLFPPTGFFVRSTWWAMGMRLIQSATVLAAAWLGWDLVKTAVLFAFGVILVGISIFADIRRLYPELYPWWRGGEMKVGLRNLSRSGVVTFVSILDLFSMQGVVLLVTGALGAAAVPLFTTLRTVANTAMQGTGFLLNPIQPDLIRYHVEGNWQKLSSVFSFFWFVTGSLINSGILAGLFFVEALYTVWTRDRLIFDRVLFSWLTAAVSIRTLGAPMQSYLTAINNLQAQSVASIARTSISLGCVYLFSHWGLSGVGAALFIAEVFASLIIPWWYTDRSFRAAGGRLNAGAVGLATLSTLGTCAALAAFAAGISHWALLTVVALVTSLVIAVVQWTFLTPDVRRRATSILKVAAQASRGLRPAR